MIGKIEEYFERINTTSGEPNWKRVFYLDKANGYSFRVSSWGSFYSNGEDNYGLDQSEALELIFIDGYVSGIIHALNLDPNEVSKIINIYREKYKKLLG
jgi:hypothetical protein